MNENIDLSIIILSYNTKDLLDQCLESVYKNTSQIQFEVIVVDNNSGDDSVKMVIEKYPKVIPVRNKTNLGYSKGNNLGIKKSSGRNILLLNSDTQIVGNSLEVMVKLLDQNNEISLVGPKLVFPDLTAQKSAGVFYSLKVAIILLLGGQRLGLIRSSPKELKKVDWVSGACLMFKRKVADAIGGLDEHLFMYMEEVEFCFRANLKGFKTYFCPEARVLHLELGGDKKKRGQAIINIYRGLLFFYQKYYSENDLRILKIVMRIKALILLIFGKLFSHRYLIETYGQALELVK